MALVNRDFTTAWPPLDAMAKPRVMKAAIPLAMLLAACGKQVPQTADEMAAAESAPKATAPTAKPFVYDEENDLIDYHFGWSAEAAAVPQLVAMFQAAMSKDKAELLANAKADKAEREKQGFPFNGYMSSTEYETAGQSGRLLSLRADFGGLYGRRTRQFRHKGAVVGSFGRQRNLSSGTCSPRLPIWTGCSPSPGATRSTRLARKSAASRLAAGACSTNAPKLSEISIIPTDKDGNGKFERLTLVADPYVAGPYVEGSYEIELPVTGDLVAATPLRFSREFRGSAAVGRHRGPARRIALPAALPGKIIFTRADPPQQAAGSGDANFLG